MYHRVQLYNGWKRKGKEKKKRIPELRKRSDEKESRNETGLIWVGGFKNSATIQTLFHRFQHPGPPSFSLSVLGEVYV